MHRLLERNITSIADRLVVLAPPDGNAPDVVRHRPADADAHRALLGDVQRLRGRVYLGDGAITAEQLTPDGRHETPEDERSWHVLTLDDAGSVTACLWYLEHQAPQSADDLRVRKCPLVSEGEWRETLRAAITSEIDRARDEAIAYAEVGGWAATRHDRCSADGLLVILATFGFSRLLGGALGVTMATERHCSAAILRRLGLSCFADAGLEAPVYYDPAYRCEMELLRFDTRRANPKYEGLIGLLQGQLVEVPVLLPEVDVPVLLPEQQPVPAPDLVSAAPRLAIPATHRMFAGAAA